MNKVQDIVSIVVIMVDCVTCKCLSLLLSMCSLPGFKSCSKLSKSWGMLVKSPSQNHLGFRDCLIHVVNKAN